MLIPPRGPVRASLLKPVGPHLPQEVGLGYADSSGARHPRPSADFPSLPLWWSQGFSSFFFLGLVQHSLLGKSQTWLVLSPKNKQGGGSLATAA